MGNEKVAADDAQEAIQKRSEFIILTVTGPIQNIAISQSTFCTQKGSAHFQLIDLQGSSWVQKILQADLNVSVIYRVPFKCINNRDVDTC